jgi:arsenate reductase-like glutaredoxin family protein
MTKPFVTNASDPVQVKEASRKARFQERGEDADLRAVLSMPEGRRFLMRHLRRCGLDIDPIVSSGSETYARLGQRNVADNLKLQIKSLGLEFWHLMEREEAASERKEP